jgi:RNA polymerase sigma-70 factor (ECF subfamily)
METMAKPDALLDRSNQVVAAVDIDALVAQHGALLLALAHTITRNWAEAEDLYQSTFEIALRNADQLREPAAAKAWLVRIESREAFRVRRRLRRFVSLDLHVEELRDDGEMGISVDLRRAIAALPPRTRAALLLHHYCGFSVEETAGALGVSPNTIKTQLRKGWRGSGRKPDER